MSAPPGGWAPLSVLAAGCVFPSGPSLALAEVAVRASLCLTRRHPCYVDRCGHPVRCSVFPTQPEPLRRWFELADAALFDLATHLPETVLPHLRERAIALWLVLPDADRPGLPPALITRLVQALEPNWAQIEVVTGTHAATAIAITSAGIWIEQRHRPALVLAIDSPHAADTLAGLEARGLVHGARTPYRGLARANPYGRIPGEAAAALLLGPRGGTPAWCHLAGLGTAAEPLTFDTEGPCVGAGLSAAAHAALEAAGPAGTRIGHLIHDANGEPYRADEFGFTALRLAEHLAPGWRRTTPALASGDLMSASLATHLAIAAWQLRTDPAPPLRHGTTPDRNTLVLASSDEPLRAALVLTPAQEA
ncbi:beta-ketoacyl synthase [Parazoarcus communis]|uniref:Beta-ketoacyl synthase n=1 Tax=Parazoarcus communis SWub3 = DSM 12120 TaxID=1121029 RepID=A0A323UZT7_9RHOO|nr:beta-ketoacyl synthase [Parazoarcus communis]NMG68830.1 beta-ketoacyl synthase [Parazoarcus communis SWub3 = DSM 12120]PZA17944.1 beta-ketoacyl synthase [Azoarcus communis] [Parazoarcus communis SWub3 = DSM 12120]